MSRESKVWFKLRGLLILPLYLFAIFCDWGDVERPWVIFPLGGVLFAFGLFLRIWAQVHLHYRLRIHKVLTTTGPYVYVRNPIYIANTIILVAISVLSGLLWFAPIMFFGCAVTYSLVVRYEEAHLTEKYGDPYVKFLSRVPRWLPRFDRTAKSPNQDFRRFIYPSVRAEMYIFLMLVPLIAKELLY